MGGPVLFLAWKTPPPPPFFRALPALVLHSSGRVDIICSAADALNTYGEVTMLYQWDLTRLGNLLCYLLTMPSPGGGVLTHGQLPGEPLHDVITNHCITLFERPSGAVGLTQISDSTPGHSHSAWRSRWEPCWHSSRSRPRSLTVDSVIVTSARIMTSYHKQPVRGQSCHQLQTWLPVDWPQLLILIKQSQTLTLRYRELSPVGSGRFLTMGSA